MIITVASGKGGVGKTSTAIAIAAAFKERRIRSVLMDLDSGGDATWSLGFDAADGALDVIEKRRTIADALAESDEGLLLLPGSPALVRLEDSDVGHLAKRLRALGGGDELLVIDTPPGFSAVATRAAIAAADLVLVPFVAEPSAERRAHHVADVAAALRVEPKILGIAVMVDARRSLTTAVLEQARIGGLPAIAQVPRAVAVPESANVGRSLLAYAPHAPASEAYRAAAEVIRKALGLKVTR